MAQNFLSDIKLGDNIFIRLGDATNGDLKIYHDGNNSKITNTTGGLYLGSDTAIGFQSADHNTNYLTLTSSLATFAGNVDVDGGELKISGNFAKLFFEDTAGTDEDAYIVNNANGLFFGKTNSPSPSNDILSLDFSNNNATFAGNIIATKSSGDHKISSSSGQARFTIETTGGNGNNVYLALKSPDTEWQWITNRGDLNGGNQGDLFLREATAGVNVLNFETNTGNATFAGDVSLTSGNELTVNNAANNNDGGIHIKNDNDLYSGALTFHTEYSGTDTHAARVQAGTNGTDAILYLQVANTSKVLTTAVSFDHLNNQTKANFTGNVTMSQSNASSSDLINQNTHGTGTSRIIAQSNTTDQNAQLVSDDANNISWVGTSTGGTNRIAFINNTNAYYDGGNFAIGETSPSSKLEIAGGSLASGTVTNLGISSALTTGRTRAYDSGSLASISTRGDATSVELVAGSSGGYYSGIGLTSRDATTVGGTVIFYTHGSERARINSSGNLLLKGTGVTSLLKFDSSSFGQIQSTSNILYYDINTQVFRNSAGTSEYARFDSSGNFMLGKTSQSSNAALTVKSLAGGNTGIILVEGDTTNDGHGLYATTDNKFVITRYTDGSFSDNFVMDSSGNVGIGTSSPASKLHVSVGNNTNDVITINSPSTNNIVIGGVATGVTYVRSFESSFEIGNTFTGGDLRLKSGNAERMRIDSSGNVGIGITSPTDKLTVNGNISIFSNKIYNGSASDSAGVSFPNSTTRIDGFNGITFHSSTTNVGSQSERMRISNTGNVGIGVVPESTWYTGGQARALQIGGTVSIFNLFDTRAVFSSNYYLTTDGSDTYINTDEAAQYYQEAGQHIWKHAPSGTADTTITWTESMRITSAGKVGIGINTPNGTGTNLQVQSDSHSQMAAHFGQGQNNSNTKYGGISLGYAEATNALYRKVAIVAEARGDGAARQNLHFLVDTANDSGSAVLADSKLSIDGFTGAATFAGDANISGGNLQIGSGHNTASAGNAVIFASYGSGTNIAGGEVQIYGGRSTGNASGGSIKFYTSPAGSSGSSANAHVQALSIDSSQNATFEGNINGKGYLNLQNGYGAANGIYLNGNPAMYRQDVNTLYFPLNAAIFAGQVNVAETLKIGGATSGTKTLIFESTTNAQNYNIDFYSNAGAVQGRINYAEGPGSINLLPNSSATAALSLAYDGNATFAGNVTINGSVDAASFTDIITNTILTASGDLDIKTVLTSRDIRMYDGNNNVALRVKGDGTGAHFADNIELASSKRIRWGAGDAQIEEGATANYSLDFSTYDGSNMTTALTLLGNNNATFAGAVRVSTLSYGDPSDDSPLGALSYGSDFVTLETNGAFPIQLKTNGTTALTIDTSQKIQAQTSGGYYLTENTTNAFSITSNGANGYLSITDEYNSSERLRITNGGNLNLLNPTATNSKTFSITNNSGTTGWTFGNGVIANSHQFVIYDNTAGLSRMLIDSSGNVGIRTTSPSYLLEVGSATQTNSNVFSGRVDGDFIFNLSKANTNLFSIRNNSSGIVHLNTQNSAVLALGSSTSTSTGTLVESLKINSAGNTTFAGSAIFSDSAYSSAYSIRRNANALIFSGGTSGYYFNRSDNSVTDLRITSDGRSFFNYVNENISTFGSGAYGGTVVVKAPSGSSQGLAILNESIGGTSEVALNFTNEFVTNQYNYLGRIVAIPESSWTGTASTRSSALSLQTNNAGTISEKVRITSSGFVGIGESSPDLQLHIKNTAAGNTGIAIENTNNAQNLDIDFYSNTGSAQGRIRYEEGAGAFNFSPNVGGASGMYLNFQNYLGVGTTSPAGKVSVVNSVQNIPTIQICNEANGGDGFEFQRWQYVEGSTDYRLGLFQQVSSGLVKYRFDLVNAGNTYSSNLVLDRGNVGIGETNPTHRLVVVGSTQEVATFKASTNGTGLNNGGALINIQNTDTTNGNMCSVIFRDSNGNSSSGIFGYHTDHSDGEGFLTFGTRNSSGTFGERMRIESDGSVKYGNLTGNGNGRHLTVNSFSYNTVFQGTSTSDILFIRNGTGLNANVGMIVFQSNAGGASGQITTNSSNNTTSYNTSGSDERLKKNITDWEENVLDKFKQIQPKKFHFKTQKDSDEKIKGYIAQNEVDKFPEAYPLVEDKETGEKRYVYNPSGMNVYLMKAIQELEARVKELENK